MLKLLKICFLCVLVPSLVACDEEEVPNNSTSFPEIGKPIAFDYDSSFTNSFQDTYYEMDLAFYIPPGIAELKNRPLMFTLSTLRNSSVAGSLLTVIEEQDMIAVSPLNGNQNQFKAVLESLIESEYIDPERVYVAGFSNGGRDIFSLAWEVQDKVKGAILLDPSNIFAGDPLEDSRLSVCIVCQEDRVGQYGGSVSQLNQKGIKSRIIGVEGTDHFGILSSYTEQEKIDCFEFVRK